MKRMAYQNTSNRIDDAGTVACEVRAELARRKMSGRELARRIAKSAVYVNRRISGEVEFSESDIRSIAAVLGVTAAKLLGETTEPASARRSNDAEAVTR